MKTFLTVYEEGKVTASWLTKGLQLLSSVVLGLNTFKAAYKNAPDPASALAAASNTTVDQLRAKLRLAGIDPDVYFDTLSNNIDAAGGIDNVNAETINSASATAQNQSQDSSQRMWLMAGIALVLVLGLGSRTRAGRRATRWAAGHFSRRWRGRRGYRRRRR